MTLEEKAKEFVSKIASGTSQEMDYYVNILVEFANEVTKELQEDLKHKKIAIKTRKERIKALEKQIVQLKCDNNYLTVKCLEVECAKKSLREQIEKMKCCANCNTWLRNDDIKYCKNCPNLEGLKILRS